MLRRIGLLWVVVGCASSSSGPDAPVGPPVDVPGQVPGNPRVGAHALHYYRLGNDPDRSSNTSISTPVMSTKADGSTIVVSIGRGNNSLFALPTDNKGNAPYRQLGEMHAYNHWIDSGTALYAFTTTKGGSDFRVSASTDDYDEITLVAVEVVDGMKIQAFEWNEVVQPQNPIPVTSNSVTTTGPATLVAFWWGDAPEPGDKKAVPNNGFTVVENILKEGALVQCAVAVKNVSSAGTYDVTWETTPIQGAQLWLVAVQ